MVCVTHVPTRASSHTWNRCGSRPRLPPPEFDAIIMMIRVGEGAAGDGGRDHHQIPPNHWHVLATVFSRTRLAPCLCCAGHCWWRFLRQVHTIQECACPSSSTGPREIRAFCVAVGHDLVSCGRGAVAAPHPPDRVLSTWEATTVGLVVTRRVGGGLGGENKPPASGCPP